MSGPDRIWADSRGAALGGNWGAEGGFCHLTGGTEYVRRDPAVLAALPEVQALIAGVLGQAASMMEDNVRHAAELGHEIWPMPDLRTLTPADAIAARDAMIAAAEALALAGVTTLHTVISDIRAATVGITPMLSELAAALVAWRDEAVMAEREACVAECKHRASTREGIGDFHLMREAERCADALRKRGEG